MIPDGKGDDDISSMEEPSLFRVVSPDVGEGGGVAATKCLCFSKTDSKISEI